MQGNEIRRNFLEFFREKQHRVVPGSSLIPARDPSLLFTNAGMNQFKEVFLGNEERPYRRAASCQKCLRVSGKHNDLEQVGNTTRHHTLFEMLGNFSFGDYFKEEAIEFAWEFFLERLGLPDERLWITVFEEDKESESIWKKQSGTSANRILRLGEAENFWSMGETGPCGPCSEIHFDRGKGIGCGKSQCGPACDCGRFTELWNLVFIQYNRDSRGKLHPLERKGIDTGLGLERIAAVLQNVETNFDTDLFLPLIRSTADLCGVTYGKDPQLDVSLRVVADHLRAIAFLISDGVIPSNDKRGYVLRRILRRAIRHGWKLGREDPFLWNLTGGVADLMGSAYPELERSRQVTEKVCKREEERFRETLQISSRLLDDLTEDLRKKGVDTIPGGEMFRLYDTYGMPLDFQEEIARDKGLRLDQTGFQEHLEKQRQRARKGWKGGASDEVRAPYRELFPRGGSLFQGYQETTLEGCKVLAILVGNRKVDELREGEKGEILLDRTPFYPEGGGQVGDCGEISSGLGTARVSDTHGPAPGVILHRVEQISGRSTTGETVSARVDPEPRISTARNHTATHLLHAALRQVIGLHVKQSGSYVGPDRLRFDISHYAPIGSTTRAEVEDLVKEKVQEDHPVQVEEMSFDDALAAGALAFFGDKYTDRVRVVRVVDFSVELCGGTHVRRTGEIGEFQLLSDSSVSSGVRRLEAFSGRGAAGKGRNDRTLLDQLEVLLKVGRNQVPQGVRRLIDQQKVQRKEIETLRQRLMSGAGENPRGRVERLGDVTLVSRIVEGANPADLRNLADGIRQQYGSGVVILGSVSGGKGFLSLSLTKDLAKSQSARRILDLAAGSTGFRGGGRDHLAEAGGPAAKLPDVVDLAFEAARDLLDPGSGNRKRKLKR